MAPVVPIENILLAAVTVFAVALTGIAVLAWRRARDSRLLFLAAAFGAFAAKGLALSIALFLGTVDPVDLVIVSAIFDLAILGLFYAFTLRR